MVDSLAMPGGQTDVYAYLIYSTFRASSGWQLAQAVLGMLVTFLMQLGIIVLLWFGVITSMHRVPPTPAVNEPGWRTIVSSVEMPLAIVNMLVIFALAVYALEEIRKAVNLSITAAACFQILPRFYLGESFSSCSTAGKGLQSVCYGRWSHIMTPVLRLLVLAAPLCQHLIGLLVLLSGIDLTFLRTNTDIVQIILDAAALIFLLELDSRVGMVLFEQHLRSVPSMKMRALSKMASSNGSSSFGLLPRTAGDMSSSGGGFSGFSKLPQLVSWCAHAAWACLHCISWPVRAGPAVVLVIHLNARHPCSVHGEQPAGVEGKPWPAHAVDLVWRPGAVHCKQPIPDRLLAAAAACGVPGVGGCDDLAAVW
jgi:hypothetical protein